MSLLSVLGGLASACAGVEPQPVAVNSAAVRDGTIALQLDYRADAANGPVLRADLTLADADRNDDRCPVLAADARVVLRTSSGETADLTLISRGGGEVGVDCALRCRELVALETNCRGAQAELRGALVDRVLAGGADVRVEVVDGTAALGVTIPAAATARRRVSFPEGSTLAVDPSAVNQPPQTTVALAWSHADDANVWANEWPDPLDLTRGNGRFTDFGAQTRDGALRLWGRASAERLGARTVYFGSRASSVGACDFAHCRPVAHVLSETVTLVAR